MIYFILDVFSFMVLYLFINAKLLGEIYCFGGSILTINIILILISYLTKDIVIHGILTRMTTYLVARIFIYRHIEKSQIGLKVFNLDIFIQIRLNF